LPTTHHRCLHPCYLHHTHTAPFTPHPHTPTTTPPRAATTHTYMRICLFGSRDVAFADAPLRIMHFLSLERACGAASRTGFSRTISPRLRRSALQVNRLNNAVHIWRARAPGWNSVWVLRGAITRYPHRRLPYCRCLSRARAACRDASAMDRSAAARGFLPCTRILCRITVRHAKRACAHAVRLNIAFVTARRQTQRLNNAIFTLTSDNNSRIMPRAPRLARAPLCYA